MKIAPMESAIGLDIDAAVLMQVIVTTIYRRGKGTEESPVRIVRQVWTTDGKLIAEYDPCAVLP